MGCGSSQATPVVSTEIAENCVNETTEMVKKYPPPEAFDVALDDSATGESLIKKHPPKRLMQRLANDTVGVSPPTIEDLEEKLANAEVRRTKFLQQRIEKIKDADESMQNTDEGIGGDDDDARAVDEPPEGLTDPENGETILTVEPIEEVA